MDHDHCMTHSDISNPEDSENTTRVICLPSQSMLHTFSWILSLLLSSPVPVSGLILRIVNIFIPDEKQDVQSTLFSA